MFDDSHSEINIDGKSQWDIFKRSVIEEFVILTLDFNFRIFG